MIDHYHNGAGSGHATRQAAERAAIAAWTDFTDLEYGPGYGNYSIAGSKRTNCAQASSRLVMRARGTAVPAARRPSERQEEALTGSFSVRAKRGPARASGCPPNRITKRRMIQPMEPLLRKPSALPRTLRTMLHSRPTDVGGRFPRA